jgi:hypothetical protein
MTRRFDPSPRALYEWRHDLVAFRDSYVNYLNATAGSGQPGSAQMRSDVVRLAHRAQSVMDRLGAHFAWESAPVTGGTVMHGLVNTVFIHETPFGGVSAMFNWPKSYEGIINLVDTCLSRLDELDVEIHRRRRNPLYWGDRILSALLGFPAYVLGLVFGVPTSRIDESPFGTALRVATFIVETAVLVLGLNELFHWF